LYLVRSLTLQRTGRKLQAMADASSNPDPQPAQSDAPRAALDEQEAALGQRISELFPRQVAAALLPRWLLTLQPRYPRSAGTFCI